MYFGIGCYVSEHSRTDKWGTGAIESISEQLKKELPGKMYKQLYEKKYKECLLITKGSIVHEGSRKTGGYRVK